MSNLVFVSGDFSSGSTLMFTLLRKTKEYYCLYEPLHEKLLEYLIWPLRVDEHHFFVEDYFAELKNFREIPRLFNPQWGGHELSLPANEDADDLYRYLNYVIGASFGKASKVMLKENRLTFRLGWMRAKFPHAKLIHVYRSKESQWKSIVKRVQEHKGRENVGQDSVDFIGFNIAGWCEDLKHRFPELAADQSKTGFERFSKLWDLSFAEHQKYADLSVDYWELTHNFEQTFGRVKECIGASFDVPSLSKWVVPKEQQKELAIARSGLKIHAKDFLDKITRKYARVRVRANSVSMRNPLIKH